MPARQRKPKGEIDGQTDLVDEIEKADRAEDQGPDDPAAETPEPEPQDKEEDDLTFNVVLDLGNGVKVEVNGLTSMDEFRTAGVDPEPIKAAIASALTGVGTGVPVPTPGVASTPSPSEPAPAPAAEPADPWVTSPVAPNVATGPAPVQQAAPAPQPAPAAPSAGQQVITLQKPWGPETWTLNAPNAPLCQHGQPAGKKQATGRSGKPYAAWCCALKAGDQWKQACQMNEFTRG